MIVQHYLSQILFVELWGFADTKHTYQWSKKSYQKSV